MASKVERAYELACERYAECGVDAAAALQALSSKSVSVQCWQGDDVGGFEKRADVSPGGGLQVTGSYPGRARNLGELQTDLSFSLSLIPGRHAANIHAMYGDFSASPADRDSIELKHFESWLTWAANTGAGLDFNATLFAHDAAKTGFTLASKDAAIRAFWTEHVSRCRRIAAAMGSRLGRPCVHNLWIPDGTKDSCMDRAGYRKLLRESLDAVYAESFPRENLRDAVESKLFGIGAESFTAGSHEFYLAYAVRKGLMVCLDMGHFHPTESVADKISAILQFSDELLLHVSRGVRWDSDHVVSFDDQLRDVAAEIVRAGALERVFVAMDYFDASLNRIAAWVIGARAVLQALLYALLEPRGRLLALEESGDLAGRMALLEEAKTMPFGAVWDFHCLRSGVAVGSAWLAEIRRYERDVLGRRG